MEVLSVPEGIHVVDGREVWLGAYTLDATPGEPDSCAGALPSVDERRVAARQPAFQPSDRFEALALPTTWMCDVSHEVLQAEGVEGWYWFGGWGASLGEAQVVVSAGDPRHAIVRSHALYEGFGDASSVPMPRGERCVHRAPQRSEQAQVVATALNLRAGRGQSFPVLHRIPGGTTLSVMYVEGEWAWIEAPKQVEDRTGPEPRVWECTILGWVNVAYLRKMPEQGESKGE